MEIQIEARWRLKASLENVINKKLMKLVTFNDRIIKAEVFLKSKENVGTKDKVVEITLRLPGPDIFAESYADTHEKAVADCAEKLRRQIIKRKEKMTSRAGSN